MDYDLAIIGAGWAGVNAAVSAKKLGLKAVIIEKEKLGGTCLNYGCIPTKTLIQSARVYNLIQKSRVFGVQANAGINFNEVLSRKDAVVSQLRQGIEFMLKGIDILQGQARFLSEYSLKVNNKEITARYILIASGSKPQELKSLKFDGRKILSSNDVLSLKKIPHSILVVGGGVIGCEFASLFFILGAEVAIAEKLTQLLPLEDKEISRKITAIFSKRGIKISTNTDVSGVDLDRYELVLVGIGRSPVIDDLGLENAGIAVQENRIKADKFGRTTVPHIYAAGDCTGQIMLAHFAGYQGVTAVYNMVNPALPRQTQDIAVPNCIFTDPEIASVGMNEENAKAKGHRVRLHRFDFLGSGMARILNETEGFVKIISDLKTGVILGASLVGPHATELISGLTIAVKNSLTVGQLQDVIFGHPSLSEAIAEAVR